ncbi:anthraniloyl-CoA:methanol acyltransferase-like [Dorcoceras hygrometricum]|uniref:Anthraniloyl-CoA:methanol acyltransferase-like n=1 Tax=Dorcoceras hygrometricum TaxID=472368 RepID=A0A2Z7ADX6_9LAMI|nr:anthraniloyl-CoA:methanol acyltransferase-like [Dorcoceras hygrometricum]
MGNTDPNNTKAGNKYEVKPQYEELSKQLIMQHAIIDAMKCMRAIKGRIARPVNQLAIHLSRASIPCTVYQPGKSSIRDLQSPSAHHSSVVFRHNQSVGHHSDDSVGLFRHNSSVGQSQRGSQIRHQPLLTTDISSSSQRNQKQPSDVSFSKEHQNDAASTNQNDTASFQQLTTDSLQNNQQLVALNNSKRRRTGHIIIAANSWSQSVTPKTLRFNLSKRRRVAPTTGSSNQQLVIQLGQFLITTQLIALQLISSY